MLVLTRKSGESITIGDAIVVNVLEIKGSQVKIGIDAPAGISVHRREVYDKIQQENVMAAGIEARDFEMAAGLIGPNKRNEKQPWG